MKRYTIIPTFLILMVLIYPSASGIEIQLKLSGGFSILGLKDINRTLLDWEEWTKKDTAARAEWTYIGGHVTKLRSGFDLEGELLLAVSPKFALGIGAGSFIGELVEEKTALTIERFADTYLDVKPTKITAIPLVFLGYIRFPLIKKWTIFAKGGAGYVWGKFIDREGSRLSSKENFNYSSFQRTSGQGPVYVGGVGLEFEYEPQVHFFFEAAGRLLKISDFEGENDLGETGTLYFFEEFEEEYSFWQAKNQIMTTEPSGQNYRSVQKAALDLGGLSLRIGLVITF
jgi:hypothetical protein